jgi:rare lipoprotein A (peptidoglycan hydrolase)
MFSRRIVSILLAVVLALRLAAPFALPALAAPSSSQTAADRAAVESAVAEYNTAQARNAQLKAQAEKVSSTLDAAVANESVAEQQLATMMSSSYRSDDASFLSVLLGASTLEDFVARWDLLKRIAQQEAETLAAMRTARVQAERSAADLMELQAAQAKAVDELAAHVAAARKTLAASEAALRDYNARTAAPAKSAPPAKPKQPTGSGAWKTAIASHYGLNFTGRGASGEAIGPYSMIVAHKTLPFGTLIEFEYNGKRAVAKVADRGPYTAGRTFDLGPGVIRVLGFSGVHEVRYRIISR